MSTATEHRAAGAAAPARPAAYASRGPRLSGLVWLVWRQHRAAYWTLLAVTALALAWIGYERTGMMDFLETHGWPRTMPNGVEGQASDFGRVSTALGALPILLGVFIGAPLLAGDLENGTAKLVASQSVSRVRWVAAKLGITALVIAVCTVALSVAFGWWWSPVREEVAIMDWSSGSAFDNTGPVPVALTLFTVMGGVAIGMLLRRTLLSMVVTFGFAVAVQLVWSHFRLDLGRVVTVTTDKGVGDNAYPEVPRAATTIDQSYITGSGDLVGWSTCAEAAPGKAHDACLRKEDIVGWSVDYLPISQMSGMQWFGASLLFALTAALAAFVFLWSRKRLA
ncbi:ABC transporter permease [Streptomyces armeniacus]|uniref:ABC transporter permease n=1 Tax=Streptomyces armeniacus TaxID=83291 RepID=A0A345XJN2_9ACTN|nr:ABC transporter permease subunit [Streptomyces armeniacus]AXK31848.1 ABC transporter permease [Streptomyces armeniacus]